MSGDHNMRGQCSSCGGFCGKHCQREPFDSLPTYSECNPPVALPRSATSAEYLAAHLTYDKGYQAGREDADAEGDKWKSNYSNAMNVNTDLRAEVTRLKALLRIAMNALADADNGLVVHEGNWRFRQHVAIEKLKEVLKGTP